MSGRVIFCLLTSTTSPLASISSRMKWQRSRLYMIYPSTQHLTDYINLANISNNRVQSFDVAVNELVNGHFVLYIDRCYKTHIISIDIETSNEVQRSIAAEDQLILSQLHNVALTIIWRKSYHTLVSLTPRHLRTHSPSKSTRSFISINS